MPKLIVAVIEEPDYANDVLMAWARAGVRSATMVDSRGMNRLRRAGLLRDDLPLIPTLEHLEEPSEVRNAMLFSVVGDEVDIDGVIAATEEIVGPLSDPDTGVLFVLPVLQVRGGQV
jgi:hypothetical protein